MSLSTYLKNLDSPPVAPEGVPGIPCPAGGIWGGMGGIGGMPPINPDESMVVGEGPRDPAPAPTGGPNRGPPPAPPEEGWRGRMNLGSAMPAAAAAAI